MKFSSGCVGIRGVRYRLEIKDVSHLRRLGVFCVGFPARQKTAGWANLFRAYGALDYPSLGTQR